jgi:hypothetical protein
MSSTGPSTSSYRAAPENVGGACDQLGCVRLENSPRGLWRQLYSTFVFWHPAGKLSG